MPQDEMTIKRTRRSSPFDRHPPADPPDAKEAHRSQEPISSSSGSHRNRGSESGNSRRRPQQFLVSPVSVTFEMRRRRLFVIDVVSVTSLSGDHFSLYCYYRKGDGERGSWSSNVIEHPSSGWGASTTIGEGTKWSVTHSKGSLLRW